MNALLRMLPGFALALGCAAAAAEIRVVDDQGRTVTLAQPAKRIVSLAPHVTELLFAAGAGERIVGTVEYSNYPEAAKRIPRVGSNLELDLERILGLEPDLIVVWLHGSAQRQLDKLAKLGIPLYYNEPRRVEDVGRAIERLGRLAGTESVALPAARAFAEHVARLRARYAGRAPVNVFYQIWEKPLMTINDNHLISDVIRLCGGRNLFGDLKPLVPHVSTEAVIEANPEAIGTAIIDANRQEGLDAWKQWPRIAAVARGNLFFIHTDLISRHAPRIVEGAEQMCEHLEAARRNRPQ